MIKRNTNKTTPFNEVEVLDKLKHYLPTQSPLKDFIHHNTLHAFQEFDFHEALQQASSIFGYKTYLPLADYRKLYAEGKISNEIIERVIQTKLSSAVINEWKAKMFDTEIDETFPSKIGKLKEHWVNDYHFNLEKMVHPILFRVIGSFLDQGISTKVYPEANKSFLSSIKKINANSYYQLFSSKRVQHLIEHTQCRMEHLLDILVGDADLYEQYLFDQQFAHPGWSGMVAVLEQNPHALLDTRRVTLHDFIVFELLLEIDALDNKFGEEWPPLKTAIKRQLGNLFVPTEYSELHLIYQLWQEAFEWTYYDTVLSGIQKLELPKREKKNDGFDALFCIDDRECSLRRHLEHLEPSTRTFGTPGFFNVDCYFQPQGGKFHTKICPAPMNPGYLIKEENGKLNTGADTHYNKRSHGLILGWLITQTLGFWSALKLFLNIFKPSVGPATTYSFRHLNQVSTLTIEAKENPQTVHGLQVGYTVIEMADRVERLIRSIGLQSDLQHLVYVVGHGASSINNTHYAGYDCGACSGRPGSVNARAFSFMANHPKVREILDSRGIHLPEDVQFVGALHDTTRDEIQFYDTELLNEINAENHKKNVVLFEKALEANAVERSRRFILIPKNKIASKIHNLVKQRSVSLFEPRPELNHATNALCIIGPREYTSEIFLDRRAFLNSYDYKNDTNGDGLLAIMQAAVPVCGGINLEYYFSRVDNYRLGAGTKLPHNVMGLIGVANGSDGDLLTGLPHQMIEVHDPIRLLMVVIQKPEIVLMTLSKLSGRSEWMDHNWVKLACVVPDTQEILIYENGTFQKYNPISTPESTRSISSDELMKSGDNIPVYIKEAVA